MKYQLAIQLPATSSSDLDTLIELENALTHTLGGQHLVDGHDFGSGTMNVFILTNYPDQAFETGRNTLTQMNLLSVAKIMFRDYPQGEYINLWPEPDNGDSSDERFYRTGSLGRGRVFHGYWDKVGVASLKPPMQTNSDKSQAAGHHALTPSAAIYTKPVLSIYDFFVLGFSSRFVWQCPSHLILNFYNEHISGHHLDVGVGTGYFLDKCRFSTSRPRIALLDLNPNSLQMAARRLRRYNPRTYVADMMKPLPAELTGFDSIALNYLLHCLPGSMLNKGVVLRHLKPLLNPGGVLFGAIILGQGVPHNFLGRSLMRIYNAKGIFGNVNDSRADLESVLRENLREYTVQVEGCVGFFVGRV